MGKLVATGFHCPKCDGWGKPAPAYGKGKIECWFKVSGRVYRYCQTCTDQTFYELNVRLGAEGKQPKTLQIDMPPQIIVLTDPSDYVEETVDPAHPNEKKTASGIILPN